MYHPVELKIKNFVSYKDAEFVFNKGQAVLINGINQYEPSQKSNGSGKSALCNGVYMSISGEVLNSSEKTISDMIMDGTDEAYTYMSFIGDPPLFNTLNIERWFYRNKPSRAKFNINGVDIKKDSVNSTTQALLDELGVTKDQLLNHYIITKTKFRSFYAATNKERGEIIKRYSGADIIDPVFDMIKDEIKEFGVILNEYEKEKSKVEGRIETLNEQSSKQKSPEDQYKDKMKAYKDMISAENDSIANNTDRKDKAIKDIMLFNKNIKDAEDNIINIRESMSDLIDYDIKIADIDGKRDTIDQKIESIKNKISVLTKEDLDPIVKRYAEIESRMGVLQAMIDGAITCPKCNHEFLISEDSTIDDIRHEMDNLDLETLTLNQSLIIVKEAINGLNDMINDERSKKDKYDKDRKVLIDNKREQDALVNEVEDAIRELESDIKDDKQKIEDYNRNITRIESQIKLSRENIGEYESMISSLKIGSDDSSGIKKAIEDSTRLLKEWETGIKEIQDGISELEMVTGYFKQFSTYLINKSLHLKQVKINEYLARMKSNISVEFSGYSISKSGNISDKISVTVYKNGILFGGISKLSEGELSKVVVATLFADQDILDIGNDKGLDLLFIDEIIGSVDSLGIKNLIESIKPLNRTICLITLANIDEVQYDTFVSVIRGSDGYSRIEMNYE